MSASLEERITVLEGLVRVLMADREENRPINGVDVTAFKRAIQATLRGDSKHDINAYLRKGGRVPMKGRTS